MTSAVLEHVNVTVSDPDRTARLLCDLFGWCIRWQGKSIHNGHTIHVGENNSYIALYRGPGEQTEPVSSHLSCCGLNHIAIVVKDLDATEARVKAAGFTPFNHADYEPGRRFYFADHDQVEYEIVCYD